MAHWGQLWFKTSFPNLHSYNNIVSLNCLLEIWHITYNLWHSDSNSDSKLVSETYIHTITLSLWIFSNKIWHITYNLWHSDSKSDSKLVSQTYIHTITLCLWIVYSKYGTSHIIYGTLRATLIASFLYLNSYNNIVSLNLLTQNMAYHISYNNNAHICHSDSKLASIQSYNGSMALCLCTYSHIIYGTSYK